jgi:hypothetical protein
VIDAIVDTDRRLESEANTSTKALAHWRWRHTLDENNPDRFSLAEYARIVGRDRSQIGRYANGYKLWRDRDSQDLSISDAIERARRSTETAEALDAVAEAHGVSVSTASRSHRDEIREVREIARERSERRGTDRAQEARTAARQFREASDRRREIREERKDQLGVLVANARARLETARRGIIDAIELLRDADPSDDAREVLVADMERINITLQLLRNVLTGETGADWDAELARLTEVS